jgi:hypothetical protein
MVLDKKSYIHLDENENDVFDVMLDRERDIHE